VNGGVNGTQRYFAHPSPSVSDDGEPARRRTPPPPSPTATPARQAVKNPAGIQRIKPTPPFPRPTSSFRRPTLSFRPLSLSFRRKACPWLEQGPESLFLLRPRRRKGARSARLLCGIPAFAGMTEKTRNGGKKRRRRFYTDCRAGMADKNCVSPSIA